MTGEQLQAEIDRIVRDTRQPELLRDLFRALDDDPLVIAECLARPALVNRLTRNWYARDARFHGAQREQAEAALASHADADARARMQRLGGEYQETEWRLVAEDRFAPEPEAQPEAGRPVELRAEEWGDMIGRIAARFGIERETEAADASSALLDRIPLGSLSRLVEKNDRFVVTAVLAAEPGRVRTATVNWYKRSLDVWWAEEGAATVQSTDSVRPVLPPDGGYRMRSIPTGGCDLET